MRIKPPEENEFHPATGNSLLILARLLAENRGDTLDLRLVDEDDRLVLATR